MDITTESIGWKEGGHGFKGHVARASGGAGKRPAVLVCHAWAGQTDFERRRAAELAALGYVGVAIDVYGEGKTGDGAAECSALMSPLLDDRKLLQRRLLAAVAAVRALPYVDAGAVGAIGFCFGGLCALDLARAGGAPAADLRAVVSFHGLLRGSGLPRHEITAKVLALHGYDDPMVKPEAVLAFAREMTEAGADWEVNAYGGTVHAFTNPQANDAKMGTVYQARADRRSRRAMEGFLAEVFGP